MLPNSFYINKKCYFKIIQLRENYHELLELVLALFCDTRYKIYKFQNPGMLQHARWKSKALYCLKIFMFQKKFLLSLCKLCGIRNMCIFVVKVYVKVRFSISLSITAANSDLNCLNNLLNILESTVQ